MKESEYKIGDVVQYIAYPYEDELGVILNLSSVDCPTYDAAFILFGDKKRWVLTFWLRYPKD